MSTGTNLLLLFDDKIPDPTPGIIEIVTENEIFIVSETDQFLVTEASV